MKTILMSMAAATALAAGSPAAAQYANGGYQNNNGQYGNGQYGVGANGNLSARIDQLRLRIDTGLQSGAISRVEVRPLRQQLRALTQLERQYSANGLSGQERSDLQQRLRSLRQQVRTAEGGAQGRYDRDDDYGQGRDDRDDGYGQGSNGRYDDGYTQPAPRSGLGGLIDSVLGRGSLAVGQRATGNLSALPYEYRNQFRDSNDAYFRTDGRQIYQIDARTQTVVRVYAMNR